MKLIPNLMSINANIPFKIKKIDDPLSKLLFNNILEFQVNVIRYETGLIIRKEVSTLLFLDDIITHLLYIFIHRQLKRLDIKIPGINFTVQ